MPVTRRGRVALAALLPVSMLLAIVATAAPALAGNIQIGMIASYQSASTPGNPNQACLDDWGRSLQPFNPVVAYPCDNADPAQFWAYDWTNDTMQYTDGTAHGLGYCLDVQDGGGIGSNLDLYPCNNTPAQVFEYNFNTYQFWNPQSGGCIDIPDWGNDVTFPPGPPIPLHVWDCANLGSWQEWYFMSGSR